MAKRELFSFAGIATDKNNITKVRYTNDLSKRVKILYKDKFTNINFVPLPETMTKIDACKYLLTCKEFTEFQIILHDEIEKRLV